MKKARDTVCMIMCTALLCSCSMGQDGQTAGAQEGQTAGVQEVQTADVQERQTTGIQGGQTADVQEGETDQTDRDLGTAVQMKGLMQGDLGGLGLGSLVYTLPAQEDEDYTLCFFKEDGKETDLGKSMQETDYPPLETADYIFPDVRENNAPIGRFVEIYFFDLIPIGGDGTAGLTVVAVYDGNGGTCYDTRIYSWDGTGYRVEEKKMQELNEKYRDGEEYPVEELYQGRG